MANKIRLAVLEHFSFNDRVHRPGATITIYLLTRSAPGTILNTFNECARRSG